MIFICRRLLPFLAQVPDKVLQLLLVEPMRHPIEARTEIVHKLLPLVHLSNLLRKPSRFLNARVTRLEPKQVCKGSKGDGPFSGGFESGAVVVETFAGARDVPGEEHWLGRHGGEDLTAAVQWCVWVCGELLLVLGDFVWAVLLEMCGGSCGSLACREEAFSDREYE